MVNEQFTWLTPLSQQDRPGLPGAPKVTKITKSIIGILRVLRVLCVFSREFVLVSNIGFSSAPQSMFHWNPESIKRVVERHHVHLPRRGR